MKKSVGKIFSNIRGATAVEYALIAGLIAIVVISGATLVGNKANTKFNQISGNLN